VKRSLFLSALLIVLSFLFACEKKEEIKYEQTKTILTEKRVKKVESKDRKYLVNFIKEVEKECEHLFQTEEDLDVQIKKANYLVENGIILIRAYQDKFPNETTALKGLLKGIIKKKVNVIVSTFWEREKSLGVFNKYRNKNLEAVRTLEENIWDYLLNVKNANQERFIGEFLSYSSMYKFIRSKDRSRYIQELFYENFLSPEMLSDAINTYMNQLIFSLNGNLNQFLVEVLEDYVEYVYYLEPQVRILDPQHLLDEIDYSTLRKEIYMESLYLNKEYIEKLSFILKKAITSEGITTGISLIPGVGWVSSIALEGANIAFQKKLASEIEESLSVIIKQLYDSIMFSDYLFQGGLESYLVDIINSYDTKKEKFLKSEILRYSIEKEYQQFFGGN
jgi:hypothetical protein